MAKQEVVVRQMIKIQRIGFPQKKECGPPYVRFESGSGKYLGAIGGAKGDKALARKLIRWLESTLIDRHAKSRK